MFVDGLISNGNGPLLEQWLQFTEARQRLLGEDIVNVSTPNYVQSDMSVDNFQSMLRDRVQARADAPPGTVGFDDITGEIEHPRTGILFHDGNNRSMEQLMSDSAKNALMHTLAVELLRQQYGTMQAALRERVS